MKTPPLRVIQPSPAQLAADSDAPYVAFVRLGDEHGPKFGAATNRYGEFGERPLIVESEGAVARIAGSSAAVKTFAKTLQAVGHPAGEMLRQALDPVRAWRLRTRSLAMDRPHVMGILNLTSDSFSGDGVGTDIAAALRQAADFEQSGVSLIDVGAESARADRPVLDEEAEARLVEVAVAALVREGHAVSCDTYKPLVARAALEAGAECINDISGLTLGTGAANAAREAGAGYVLNYSYSVPKKRPDSPPVYEDVVAETLAWMFERVQQLRELGLPAESIAVDPGIAFGKSHDEDLQVLRRIGELRTLGLPLLIAHSRKNFIGSVNGLPPGTRDIETHAVSALAYEQGARIFRVHDVGQASRVLQMAAAVTNASAGDFAPDATSWPWRAGASTPHTATAAPDKEAPTGQRW